MSFRAVFVITLSCMSLWISEGQFVSNEFQFETLGRQPGDGGNRPWVWRSEAAQMKTLRLAQVGRKTVTLTLCSEPATLGQPVTAYIENIRYSNDGPADRVDISINRIPIATFETEAIWNWGHHWNVFYDTGRMGRSFTMLKGRYQMRLQANTDQYGMELDSIDIRTSNQDPKQDIICKAEVRED